MSQKMAHTRIIQNAIPVRYDPRVEVKPCEPARVPQMPLDILYQIAKALPQPKQVFNLALASKDTWEYLQPALYQCEVTYEKRLAHKYGGESSLPSRQYSRSWAALYQVESRSKCQGGGVADDCAECEGRIRLEERIFKAIRPKKDDPIRINGAMTALHWAAKQGSSALPVAQKAIRSALAHQPSYINGVNLQERRLCARKQKVLKKYIPADLPPPIFLAVAHGNFEVFKALLDAGCAVNLLQGGSVDGYRSAWSTPGHPGTSFKIHEGCIKCGSFACIFEYKTRSDPLDYLEVEPRLCQTAGHIAVRYEQPEMLKILLQSGLDIQPPQPRSLHLAQFAVREANLDALKVLLDHDPSLAHIRLHHGSLLHSVRFIKRKARRDVRDGLMRSTISCLLDHGVDIHARVDEFDRNGISRSVADDRGRVGVTALQAALLFHETTVPNDLQVSTALHAAEVLVRMGSNWNQKKRPSNTVGSILPLCLVRTVIKEDPEMWFEKIPEEEAFTAKYVEVRAAWGRVLKSIVETACKPQTRHLTQNIAAAESLFPALFADLVRIWSKSDASDGTCCPLAAKGIGELLLSTGITPSDEDLKKWSTLCSDDDKRV